MATMLGIDQLVLELDERLSRDGVIDVTFPQSRVEFDVSSILACFTYKAGEDAPSRRELRRRLNRLAATYDLSIRMDRGNTFGFASDKESGSPIALLFESGYVIRRQVSGRNPHNAVLRLNEALSVLYETKEGHQVMRVHGRDFAAIENALYVGPDSYLRLPPSERDFLFQYSTRLDEGNRFAIPAEMRETLNVVQPGSQFVFLEIGSDHLLIKPEPLYNLQRHRLDFASPYERQQFGSRHARRKIDLQGRIALPQKALDVLQFSEQGLVVHGALDVLKIEKSG